MTAHRIAYSAEAGVARLVLDNPAGRNAVDMAFVEAFADCAQHCAEDESVKVIMISATGDFFSVGGDLTDFLAHETDIRAHVLRMAQTFHRGIATLHNAPAPVVLALKGMAAGGGFSLVCGADYVIAASSARLTSAYTRTGLTPDGGATYFLERIIGYRKAFEILALNPVMSALEAQQLGIVNKIIAEEEWDTSVELLVRKMREIPSDALIHLKRLVRGAGYADLGEQLAREAESVSRQASHPQTLQSLRAFLGRP